MRVTRPRLFLLGIAVVAGVFLSREGWVRAIETRAEARAASKDLDAAENERQRVAKRIAEAESPVGQEENARARGFRRPDETPVSVQ
ncbi:MAG: hypothetical protein AB7F50_04025 [Fimbriimonadaceae bacterium]